MRKMSVEKKIVIGLVIFVALIGFGYFKVEGLNDYTVQNEICNVFGYDQVIDFRYSDSDFKVAYAKVVLNSDVKLDIVLNIRTLYSRLSQRHNVFKKVDTIVIDFIDFSGVPVAKTTVNTNVLYGTEWGRITQQDEMIKQASIKF
ncbi:hypothetical protein 10S12_13 [uncultured Caudovirales phage]|uniref:Uncharacterized protein n=1 Tax=uncultured Caudovirales phage TaxID=2100421 RepID=A0A2H4JAJ7_9CAUD|nr:hypothetical protein 10S12_13 [uncultured Caudovirales phage]